MLVHVADGALNQAVSSHALLCCIQVNYSGELFFYSGDLITSKLDLNLCYLSKASVSDHNG